MQIEQDVRFLKLEDSSRKTISQRGGKDSDIKNLKLLEHISDPKAAETELARTIPRKLHEGNLPLSMESQDYNENINNIGTQEDGNNIESFDMEKIQNFITRMKSNHFNQSLSFSIVKFSLS